MISGRTDLSRQRQTTINVWTHGGCIEGVLLENTVPTKDKIFSIAIGVGVYSSQEESANAGDTWDICCARCGADEESINHLFF